MHDAQCQGQLCSLSNNVLGCWQGTTSIGQNTGSIGQGTGAIGQGIKAIGQAEAYLNSCMMRNVRVRGAVKSPTVFLIVGREQGRQGRLRHTSTRASCATSG